jgi:hypothetical protein
MLITPTQKDHITVNEFSDSLTGFDGRKYAFDLALLNDALWERRTTLHQGEIAAKKFLLFYALESHPRSNIWIPAAESTKLWQWIPCKFDIDLYISGDPAPTPLHVARFHVDARNWKSIKMKQEKITE